MLKSKWCLDILWKNDNFFSKMVVLQLVELKRRKRRRRKNRKNQMMIWDSVRICVYSINQLEWTYVFQIYWKFKINKGNFHQQAGDSYIIRFHRSFWWNIDTSLYPGLNFNIFVRFTESYICIIRLFHFKCPSSTSRWFLCS